MSRLIKTEGIILQNVKYGESSVISKMYTEELGLQSFYLRGVRKKKASLKAALIQPGTIVELVAYINEKRSVQHIRELKHGVTFNTIPFDMAKTAIMIFMLELFYKSVEEIEPNPELFHFLKGSIETLDSTGESFANLHLLFAVGLTKHLGFYPLDNYDAQHCLFNLQEGEFQPEGSLHPHLMNKEMSQTLKSLLDYSNDNKVKIALNAAKRMEFLEKIIEYYKIHLPIFQEIKSHTVLSTVLS